LGNDDPFAFGEPGRFDHEDFVARSKVFFCVSELIEHASFSSWDRRGTHHLFGVGFVCFELCAFSAGPEHEARRAVGSFAQCVCPTQRERVFWADDDEIDALTIAELNETIEFVLKIWDLDRLCEFGNPRILRVGGEEFCVVLPGATTQEAANVAERIRACINRKEILVMKSTTTRISASLGVSSTEEDGNYDFEQLQSIADVHLYLAKQQGRNQVTWRDADKK